AARSAPDAVAGIARASRIRVRRVLLRDAWWKRPAGPILAFRRDSGQPVALLPNARGYELYEPAAGERTAVGAKTAATLAFEAYVFVRPFGDGVVGALGLLKLALEPYRREMLWLCFAGLATAVLGMLTPQALGIMVDRAIPNADRNMALDLGLGLATAALSIWLLRIAEDVAFMRMELGAEYTLQLALWDRILRIRVPFFRQYASGDMQARASAVSEIRARLSGSTLRSLFTSALALLFVAQMFYFSADLTWIALGVALAAATATGLGGVLIQRTQRRVLDLQGRVAGLTLQLIDGVAKLRVACAEERAYAFWAREFTRKERESYAAWRVQNLVATLNGVVAPVGTILLYACVSALLAPGSRAALSTGDFLAFHAAYGGFILGVSELGTLATGLLEIPGLWARAKPLLNAPLEVAAQGANPGRLAGNLSVENLVFRYRDGGQLVMNGLSMNVRAGEFVALVGPSGAGKSTLFRILLGIDAPESGSVYYDGQDLSGIDVTAVRRQIGVVLQNAQVFSGSLLENMSPEERVGEAQALEAARLAGLADDLEKLPMGLLTMVNEGATNLSGGQRQRLLLARALVHRPRILLLDEATSSLDNRTQSLVSANLARLKVTRLVIAHRLSTIRHADRILVMDQGRIVQEGTFETLRRQPGLFAQLTNQPAE
ncbi:MAG: NHLP bacteriocin export ABC transporter permease/ATPase subunit, partial [Planctomycetota bacterium]|nr:NHLP bacteriocin export ABC transporter permease/ATPase subunit [Planctomycetota bacterium]